MDIGKSLKLEELFRAFGTTLRVVFSKSNRRRLAFCFSELRAPRNPSVARPSNPTCMIRPERQPLS